MKDLSIRELNKKFQEALGDRWILGKYEMSYYLVCNTSDVPKVMEQIKIKGGQSTLEKYTMDNLATIYLCIEPADEDEPTTTYFLTAYATNNQSLDAKDPVYILENLQPNLFIEELNELGLPAISMDELELISPVVE